MNVDKRVDADVLVIGGGGAALRAAVAAHDAGARVIVALKGALGRCGATVSPNSRGVAWQMADECASDGASSLDASSDVHYRNILDAGLGMADPRLARLLAYEVTDRARELEHWGLRFIPDPTGRKRHYSAYSCFGDRPRAHGILNSGHGHAGDIVVVLGRQLAVRQVTVHEDVYVTDLIAHHGACRGALALGPDGQILAYRAGAVVLGAGGARQIYPAAPGREPIDTTGDGYAMALRAGAQLCNMEFGQYMLHAVPTLPGSGSTAVQCPGSFWALYPTLRNRHGEDALAPYLPPGVDREQAMWARTLHYPFSCRDASGWLDVAIASEIRAGRGSEQGALYLDFRAVDLGAFRPSRPQHLPEDRERPVVLPEGLVQVRTSAHAVNGGVVIDEHAATTLPGLYAAGEVAAGPHGADRLGGGMVTHCQVFGARAGRYAAEHARDAGAARARARDLPPQALEQPLERLHEYGQGAGGTRERSAQTVLDALQAATGEHLVVVRNERGLRALLARIKELREEWLPRVSVPDVATLRRAMEVENSLLTAELMARSALARQESRGSHYRKDYPRQDDENWRVNVFLRMEGGRLRQETGRLAE
jgi:succinate dehydrogenase/fumarate reductase flavoprotein subunit